MADTFVTLTAEMSQDTVTIIIALMNTETGTKSCQGPTANMVVGGKKVSNLCVLQL